MKAKLEFKSLPNELKNLVLNQVENWSCFKLLKVNRDTRNRCLGLIPFLQKIVYIHITVGCWKSENEEILCNKLGIRIYKDKNDMGLEFNNQSGQVCRYMMGAVIGNENQKLFQKIKASKKVFIQINGEEFDEDEPRIEFLKFLPRNWHTSEFTLMPEKFDVIRQVFEHTKPTIECELRLNTRLNTDLGSLEDEEREYLKSLMSHRFPNTPSFYSGYPLKEMHEILKLTNVQLYETCEERWENLEKTVRFILNKGLPSRNEKMILTVNHLIADSHLETYEERCEDVLQRFDELFALLQDKNFSCTLIEDKDEETKLLNVFEKREENLFGKRIYLNGSFDPFGAFVRQRFFRRRISPEMNCVYMAAIQEICGEDLHEVVFGATMERVFPPLSE